MAQFDPAFNTVLKLEGGYVDHELDSGGATKHGISLKFLQSVDSSATKETVKNLTIAEAKELYYQHFWRAYQLSAIRDQAVANKLFSAVVNMRPKTAIRSLQNAASDLGVPVKSDGLIGPKTINAANYCKPLHLLVCLKWHLNNAYNQIVKVNPSQNVFISGWRNRAFCEY